MIYVCVCVCVIIRSFFIFLYSQLHTKVELPLSLKIYHLPYIEIRNPVKTFNKFNHHISSERNLFTLVK